MQNVLTGLKHVMGLSMESCSEVRASDVSRGLLPIVRRPPLRMKDENEQHDNSLRGPTETVYPSQEKLFVSNAVSSNTQNLSEIQTGVVLST